MKNAIYNEEKYFFAVRSPKNIFKKIAAKKYSLQFLRIYTIE
jgi:hypothetical protein